MLSEAADEESITPEAHSVGEIRSVLDLGRNFKKFTLIYARQST
ncbi:hypothetical protein DDI_3797 [Dickeya dianthicola RNS04.9]|nr:hypothetical protein DDI_3797 [Dickeya dianthicola RNS04.9]